MERADVIVIGAGTSGMSLAYGCARQGLETLVLESAPTPGGCVQSHRPNGFWLELGAHTCYNSYGGLLAIIEARPGLDQLIPRKKVPFRLFVDGKIAPITRELSIVRLLLSAPRILTAKKAGASVQSYYSQIVGRKNYERLFGRLLSAVPSQKADAFPAEMLFKKRSRRKDVPRSFTMHGGLQSAIDAMAEEPKVTLRTNARAQSVQQQGEGWNVTLASGENLVAKYLGVATPPPAAAPLLAEVAPAAAGVLAGIKAVTVRSLGLVVRHQMLAVEPVAGIIPISDAFCSAVSRDTVPDSTYRGFTFHLTPQTSFEDGMTIALGVLGIERNQVEEVVQRQVILPSPVVGHDATVREIEADIAGKPLLLSGNYFAGLAIEDCVLRSASEVARLRTMIAG